MAVVKRVALAVIGACAIASPPALAASSGFVSLGSTPLFSDPSCAAVSTGLAICAAAGSGSVLLVDRYAKNVWSGWKALTVTLTGKPSCTATGAGTAVCAMRDAQDRLEAVRYNGATWAAASIGGTLSSDPSCAGLAGSAVLCAALDANGAIQSAYFSGTAWKLLPVITTIALSPVSCTPDGIGHAVCAWTGQSNEVMVAEFTGTKWLSALDIGGRAVGPPACEASGLKSGEVLCYGYGLDTQAYANTFVGGAWAAGNWTGWTAQGGSMTALSCAENGAHALEFTNACAATGFPGGELYVYTPGNAWKSASKAAEEFIGDPSCVSIDTTRSPGQVLCVVQAIDNIAESIVLQ